MDKERFRPLLRIFTRITLIVFAIIVIDAAGLGLLLYSQGRLQYEAFMASLILLMLLEGCFTGAAGAFLFFGFDFKAMKEGNPAMSEEQKKQLKERRASQQRWALSMVAAGLLLIFLGFLISTLAQI